jgi:predicted transcriptional regulator of viral defense system
MTRSSRDAARALLATAVDQGGYFTAKQARRAGYDYSHLDYHVSVGNFERVEHGLYRVSHLPPGEHDDLVRLSLWSRNRQDEPQAVVSHESALVLHDLSDLLPDKVHLTVPPAFRKLAPAGCVFHRGTLAPVDVEEWVGFRVTGPLRTLLDVAASSLPQEQLGKAVADALDRGLVPRRKLSRAAQQGRRSQRLLEALDAHREVAS